MLLSFVRATLISVFAVLLIAVHVASDAAQGSFAHFDEQARAGEKLNVVFFGASLTWGANASDPNLTSYRARIAQRFEVAYPKAHFHFYDAAIGGTNSP